MSELIKAVASRTPALYLCQHCGYWRAIPLEEHVIFQRNDAQLPCFVCKTIMQHIEDGNTRLQVKQGGNNAL